MVMALMNFNTLALGGQALLKLTTHHHGIGKHVFI